jgi:hypothetical protein
VRRVLHALACMAALTCSSCQVASAPVAVPPDLPSPAPLDFDVGIDGAYITQSVQDYAGTVPLVRGRAGLLRVFLRASRPDIAAPAVRVRVVETATGISQNSYTLEPSMAVVPTYLVEGAKGGSWNLDLPGADIEPEQHIEVEIDAVPGVPADRQRSSFRLPAEGSLDVRSASQLQVSLVPIVQSGLHPDVTGTRTADSWIDRARWIHPLGGVDVRVVGEYTTDTQLGPGGSGWPELVAELEAKRVVEANGRTYLGVVRTSYSSGTAGRADRPGHTAIAWDDASTYQRVAAHELGHNFGLQHAPCGPQVAGVDPAFPYDGGTIGKFGWDPVSGAVKDPAATWDHMSYCGDTETTWTSDYNYRSAMDFLANPPAVPAAFAARQLAFAPDDASPPARQECLVVSGRVQAGHVELNPAHVVETIPSRPAEGEYTLDLLDRDGGRMASYPFAPTVTASEQEGEPQGSHFAMALPLSTVEREAVEGLAVRKGDLELVRRVAARGPSAAAASRVETGASPRQTRVRWDNTRHPEVMIRDPRTGEVLRFARGGTALVHTDAPELELSFSDGVRSERLVRRRAR